MEEIHHFFEPENWNLLRYDQNSSELFFVIAEGIDDERVKDIRLKVGEGITGTVAHSKKPVFVPDTSVVITQKRKGVTALPFFQYCDFLFTQQAL